MPRYETPAAFDRALKKAVRETGSDPGATYRQALRDRFLCRIFADEDERFVLKGASGMLARIPDARNTKDLDFATRRAESKEEVLDALENLLSADLGDWCRFKLTSCEEAVDDNGYSRLLRLRYATFIGETEKDPILVDLSLDCEITKPPERLDPLNRVHVDGVGACPYLLYPLEDQMADKLCAIMERRSDGRPSSRMKDLADVVVYACNERFKLRALSHSIACECERRGMDVPDVFAAPAEWGARFEGFAKKNGVPVKHCSFAAACALASKFFNPAFDAGGAAPMLAWSPATLEWAE